MKNSNQKVWKEFDKIRDKVNNVYVILNGDKKIGQISCRWTYSQCYIAHVALVMYGKEDTLTGYEVLSGGGYDKFSSGLEHILFSLREPLQQNFGIELVSDCSNHWKDCFHNSGYQLIQVF